MTAFANFVIANYPYLIHISSIIPNKLYFNCAEAPSGLCYDCPSKHKHSNSCNYFTKSEASFITSHFPELLL